MCLQVLWHKKWGVILILAVSLLFNSCQKETLLDKETTTGFEHAINDLPISVDANTLVFETEEDFQECIDFLNEASDKDFDIFEKTLNFSSYRSSNKSPLNSDNVELEDILFTSLINPNTEVIVGNYLFQINFQDRKTHAFQLGANNKKLKSIKKLDFSFDDDVFELIESGGQSTLKRRRYCTNNKNQYKDWEFNRGDMYNYAKLNAKVHFQRYGIYNAIMIKFKATTLIGLFRIYGHYVTIGSNYYTPRRRSTTYFARQKSTTFSGTGQEIWNRPYSSTRRLKNYRVSVSFDYRVTQYGGNLPPSYPSTGNRTLTISCSK